MALRHLTTITKSSELLLQTKLIHLTFSKVYFYNSLHIQTPKFWDPKLGYITVGLARNADGKKFHYTLYIVILLPLWQELAEFFF